MSSPGLPVVIDCDPGHDDAVAILLAAGSPTVELLGITTVAGNQTLERTTRNARVVATVGGIDVPVRAGCARPLLRHLRTAGEIHGETGLDGPPPVEPAVPLADGHAVDWLIDTILARPGEVTLVATGPLTNVALAVRREPRIVAAVRRMVLMGGSAGRGNVTPAAEYNIRTDPEAAAIVFGEPWSVTMVGLDVTHQALCVPKIQERLERTGAAGRFVGALIDFYRARNAERGAWPDPPVHDPVAVAAVIDPGMVRTEPATVEVETASHLTAGMTVVDFAARSGQGHRVATGLDVDAFWALVLDALGRL